MLNLLKYFCKRAEAEWRVRYPGEPKTVYCCFGFLAVTIGKFVLVAASRVQRTSIFTARGQTIDDCTTV